MDKKHQTSGIIPNIIHSLDASHLINVVNSSYNNKIKPIVTIHDCFGTHPNNLQNLSHLVKIEFINLYTQEKFLEKFHFINKQVIENNELKIQYDKIIDQEYVLIKRTKHYLPNIPKLGDLDLNQIIYSKHLIT
jgi:DNA-directed RNA polymerase